MKMYKLQKGTISTIATDDAAIKAAQASGYVLLGECDENYNVIAQRVESGRKPRESVPESEE